MDRINTNFFSFEYITVLCCGTDKMNDDQWIDPMDGMVKKRGKPQFFINRDGAVCPVSEEEYMFWKTHYARKTSEVIERVKKKGEANIGGATVYDGQERAGQKEQS